MFAPLLWQQYVNKSQKFEEIKGFISETSSTTTIIIHCRIFSYSHWSRAYVEFSVFLSWREHMTNKSRICHVVTLSETNTRFICHVLTPSELFLMFVSAFTTVFGNGVCLICFGFLHFVF